MKKTLVLSVILTVMLFVGFSTSKAQTVWQEPCSISDCSEPWVGPIITRLSSAYSTQPECDIAYVYYTRVCIINGVARHEVQITDFIGMDGCDVDYIAAMASGLTELFSTGKLNFPHDGVQYAVSQRTCWEKIFWEPSVAPIELPANAIIDPSLLPYLDLSLGGVYSFPGGSTHARGCFGSYCCFRYYDADYDPITGEVVSLTPLTEVSPRNWENHCASYGTSCTASCDALDFSYVKSPKRSTEANNIVSNSMVVPNPATGIANLKFDSEVTGNLELIITDSKGAVMLETNINKSTNEMIYPINVESFAKGVFLYCISCDGKTLSCGKFIVE